MTKPDDSGAIIAGLLCFLMALYLCTRSEPPVPEPVSMTGSATRCSDALSSCPTGWTCSPQGRCERPGREGGIERGGSGTGTSSGGGGRKKAPPPKAPAQGQGWC